MQLEYFVNQKGLKRPFTEEELIDVLKTNDLKYIRNELVEHGIYFVIKIVNEKFYNTKYDMEDLIQEGTIGLIKAANTYDLAKNVKFMTYAKVCIVNEILMYLRKMKKFKEICELDEYSKELAKDGIIKKELIPYPNDDYLDFENKVVREYIKNTVYNLESREKELVIKYFGFLDRCYSQQELAEEYNLSQSYISRVILKSLEKIKKQLEKEDIIDKNIKKLKK